MKINTTKMATPIEEMVDQNLKVRSGMVTISDGKSKHGNINFQIIFTNKKKLI